MKVGNPADTPPAGPVQTPAPAQRTASGEAAKAPAPQANDPEASATVALSSTAASLLSESSAEFDADKVARISQAISDGNFHIDAEAIADKLIANAREVLDQVSH